MKVKEVSRTANMAWSPSAVNTIHVACGTVAQQLDATFRYVDLLFSLITFIINCVVVFLLARVPSLRYFHWTLLILDLKWHFLELSTLHRGQRSFVDAVCT